MLNESFCRDQRAQPRRRAVGGAMKDRRNDEPIAASESEIAELVAAGALA